MIQDRLMEMTEKMYGLCYGPYRDGQDPEKGPRPTVSQIDEDLGFISNLTNRIRVYSSQDFLSSITSIATKHNLKVNLGLWISDDLKGNDREIDEATKMINGKDRACIECVTVGNEVLARREWGQASLGIEKLFDYISKIKNESSRYGIPITTAEPWHIWQKYRNLADKIDLVTAHIYPYWDKQNISNAIRYIIEKYNMTRSIFPGKKIILGETGWPTGGKNKGGAFPSESNLFVFLSKLTSDKDMSTIPHYLFEVFDECWKKEELGNDVGRHWGIADSKGIIKPALKRLLSQNAPAYQKVWR